MSAVAPRRTGEAALAARWAAGLRRAVRLEDGRALRVIFPGVPGGASGPDFRGAILDAGGDLLRGDVEVHLAASGWRVHGHASDQAYAAVVLHVVGENDTGALTTLHAGGRAIAVLVLRPAAQVAFPPPFTPPCALAVARGLDAASTLARLSERRLRLKAARVGPFVAAAGSGQALYTLILEQLAGPANRAAFGSVARRLPLAALLEEREPGRGALALSAALKHAAAQVALRRAGLRPMAAPAARFEAAALLIHRLWPPGTESTGWPPALEPPLRLATLRVPGLGRETAIEIAANAVLPVALAAGAWEEPAVLAAWQALPSPGTYGKLRRLEGWLRGLPSAAALQGALLLHTDYCTKGKCGRCPLSDVQSPMF